MARSCRLARRHAHAIWVGNSNGTNGRVGVQNSSLFKLLRWDWNLEKAIATGTHNSEPLDHLERRLTAPGGEARSRGRSLSASIRGPLTAKASWSTSLASRTIRLRSPPTARRLEAGPARPSRATGVLAVALEQIQMLSPINRVATRDRCSRIVRRLRGRGPSRDQWDDHRQPKNHRDPKSEAISFLCHVCLVALESMSLWADFRRPNRRDV